jgi:hypothetical protein
VKMWKTSSPDMMVVSITPSQRDLKPDVALPQLLLQFDQVTHGSAEAVEARLADFAPETLSV